METVLYEDSRIKKWCVFAVAGSVVTGR